MSSPQQLKLPQRLIRDYDRRIIKCFRLLEDLCRKLATFRHHLHFTLHGKHQQLIPNSLRIKTGVRGESADRIIQHTQNALVNERIRQINTTIHSTTQNIADANEYLFTSVTNADYKEIMKWVDET